MVIFWLVGLAVVAVAGWVSAFGVRGEVRHLRAESVRDGRDIRRLAERAAGYEAENRWLRGRARHTPGMCGSLAECVRESHLAHVASIRAADLVANRDEDKTAARVVELRRVDL